MVSQMRSLILMAVLASASLLAVGCGKDKTVDEYNREKLQKSISVYQEISGTYTGKVVTPATGKTKGALQLDLSVDTKTGAGTGSDTTGGLPALVTNIRYLDKSLIDLTVDSSYYDQDNGYYSAQYKAATTLNGNSEQVTLRIVGQITGSQITGRISTLNDPDNFGTFSVQRGGRELGDIAADGTSGTLVTSGTERIFTGTGKPQGGKSRYMSLRATRPSRDARLDFLELFYPNSDKALNISVETFKETVYNSFENIRWDSKNGEIRGSQSNSSGGMTYTSYLDCKEFYFLEQKKKFTCTFSTSRSPVIVMTFEP